MKYKTDNIAIRVDEEGKRFVTHKALRDAIEENGLIAKTELKAFLPKLVVAETTITDPSCGYTVTEVGSVGRYGTSAIAKEFPVEVAFTGAYDHAAVSILGLISDGPIWSYSNALDNQMIPGAEGKLFVQDRAAIKSHFEIKHAVIASRRFTWAYKMLVCDEESIVVECTMTDRAKGRTFVDIGSSLPENRRTGQEKTFAVELAYNRAFDRAAIAALYNETPLPEGVRGIYSNMEIIPQALVSDTQGGSAEAKEEPAPVNLETEIFGGKESDKMPNVARSIVPPVAPEASPLENLPKADDEIIAFGICKGKTFAEVRGTQEAKKTVAWILDSGIEYPDEKRKAQVARFLEENKDIA